MSEFASTFPFTLVDQYGKIMQMGRSMELPDPGELTLLEENAPSIDHYYANGQWLTKPEKPSEKYIWDWPTQQWIDPRTLNDIKLEKWLTIKRARSSAEFGGFTWDGSPFDSDAISQSRIQGAVQLAAMAPGFTIDWTLANNSVRNLSAADLANVGAALGMHIAAQHAKARLLRSQIEAATTVAEVDAVTW